MAFEVFIDNQRLFSVQCFYMPKKDIYKRRRVTFLTTYILKTWIPFLLDTEALTESFPNKFR